MNVEPGDLAYVVVPPGFSRLLAGKFVDVSRHGTDDIMPKFTAAEAERYPHQLWFCTFHVPFLFQGRTVHGTYLLDSWLRPIRSQGEDVADQVHQPLPTTVPQEVLA